MFVLFYGCCNLGLTVQLWPCQPELQNPLIASLQKGKTPPTSPGYDAKQSDGEVSEMLNLLKMQRMPSLPSLPGSPWPGVVAHDRVLSMGQILKNSNYA